VAEIRSQLRGLRAEGGTTVPIHRVSRWLVDLEAAAIAMEETFPPVPDPVPPASAEVIQALVKRVRPPFTAEYWQTDGWRCLRLNTPTIRFIRNKVWVDAGGQRHQGLHQDTDKFMQWVRKAAKALGLRPTSKPVRVYFLPGKVFTFVAWREDLAFRGDVHPADVDNLEKSVYDALTEFTDERTGERFGAWSDDSQILSSLTERHGPEGPLRERFDHGR
jgi:hypothetical protein